MQFRAMDSARFEPSAGWCADNRFCTTTRLTCLRSVATKVKFNRMFGKYISIPPGYTLR